MSALERGVLVTRKPDGSSHTESADFYIRDGQAVAPDPRRMWTYVNGKRAEEIGPFTSREADAYMRSRTTLSMPGQIVPDYRRSYLFPQMNGHVDVVEVPADEEIVGAVGVLQTWENEWYFFVRETMDKPHFDKRNGDYSLPAGGREVGESVLDVLGREISQETWLAQNQVTLDPHPIGFFQFRPHNKFPNGAWITAYNVYVRSVLARNTVMRASDGETHSPSFHYIRRLDLNRLPLRGGMRGILEAAKQGLHYVVQPTSPGRHIGDPGVVDPAKLIVDANGNMHTLVWEQTQLA